MKTQPYTKEWWREMLDTALTINTQLLAKADLSDKRREDLRAKRRQILRDIEKYS